MADISKIKTPNGNEYDLKVYTDHIAPMMSKTFTGVVGTANTDVGCTFFFGTVKPISYYDIWKIKYRVYAHITGTASTYNQYAQARSEATWFGSENTYQAYHNLNQIHNTSYRPAYYNTIYNLKKAGFDAGLGHALGIGLRYSWNAYDSSYPREITIQILQCENCQFTFLDNMVQWTALPNFNSTNYETYRQTDFASNGLQETSDNNSTTANHLYHYNNIKARVAITAESLIVGDSTGYEKVGSGVTFDITYAIVWCTGAVSQGSSNYASMYLCHYDRNLQTGVKSGYTSTANKVQYLIVTISGNIATIDSSIITDTLPSTDDGKVYIELGKLGAQSTGANYFFLYPSHHFWWYKNGKIRPYGDYGHTVAKDVPANAKFTDTVTTVSTTGNGNAVTAVTASNGALTVTKGTTFLTSHQDISGKADKSATVSTVTWDSTNKKLTKTINGTTTDVVTAATLRTGLNVADGAEVNQNAFSNVKVGSTTIAADAKTDTVELVAGSNITLTPDATNDKITIVATDTTYTAASETPLMDGTAAVGTSVKYAREDHRHPTDTSRAPTSHASTGTTYGIGTNNNYGHVKLSDAISGSAAAASGGTAATPKAVSDAKTAAINHVIVSATQPTSQSAGDIWVILTE